MDCAGVQWTSNWYSLNFSRQQFEMNCSVWVWLSHRNVWISRKMADLKKITAELNSELEAILTTPDGRNDVTNYLKKYLRNTFVKRYIMWLICITFLVAILSASIYYIPFLNWNASAIGRLVLIKLILPYYDWQHLYRSRCLIGQFPKGTSHNDEFKTYNEFNTNECNVCENLGKFSF